jgi:hypothetical protein
MKRIDTFTVHVLEQGLYQSYASAYTVEASNVTEASNAISQIVKDRPYEVTSVTKAGGIYVKETAK